MPLGSKLEVDCIGVLEPSMSINEIYTDFLKLILVAVIYSFDVVLYVLSKHSPIISEFNLASLGGIVDIPAIVFSHLNVLFDLS
jgi:hypothetical protein